MALATPPRSAGPRAAGFTLVEMLVVIAILGVLLLVGNSTMRWLLPETSLGAAARTLASNIEDARNEAVLRGREVRIEYRLGDGESGRQSYRIILEPGPGEEADFEEIEYDLDLSGWVYFPPDVRVQGLFIGEDDFVDQGYYSFIVQPNGTLASHVVQLRSPELDMILSLEVSSLMDDVHLHEGALEPFYLREDDFR